MNSEEMNPMILLLGEGHRIIRKIILSGEYYLLVDGEQLPNHKVEHQLLDALTKAVQSNWIKNVSIVDPFDEFTSTAKGIDLYNLWNVS